MAPSDENECRQMLYTGYCYDQGPSAVRYPRGSATGAEQVEEMTAMAIGKGLVRRQGKQIAILNFGTTLLPAWKPPKPWMPQSPICALSNPWMKI